MGIQDDMYDVEHAVKGTDAEEAFDRFSTWAGKIEAALEEVVHERAALIKTIKIVNNE